MPANPRPRQDAAKATAAKAGHEQGQRAIHAPRHTGRRRPGPVRRAGLAAVTLTVLGACATPTPYDAPRFGFMSRYQGGSDRPVLLSNDSWWAGLRDPVLDALIDRALAQNLSLEIARARIEEARAALRAVPGAATLTTSAGLRVQGTRTGGSDSIGPNRVGLGDIGLSWMLDPYGARRAELRAAGARIEVADAELDAARLLLIYNLANAYVELRYRQRLLHLAQDQLRSRRQLVDLVRQLAAASGATRLDITRAAARLAQIEAELPGDEARVIATQNQIAVLTGVQPGTLDIALGPRPQPVSRLAPDVGIPADLLRNRPDIRIAERSYYADVAAIDRARAALYPSLSLTGAITLNALQGGGTAAQYYLGPALQFPALPAGAARATVTAAHARARQSHLNWTTTVLGAILEVENALIDYRSSTRALEAATRAARLYDQARDLTRKVFGQGEATLSDLIDAEEDRANANIMLAQAVYQQGLAFVALNVRLGSGSAAGR